MYQSFHISFQVFKPLKSIVLEMSLYVASWLNIFMKLFFRITFLARVHAATHLETVGTISADLFWSPSCQICNLV